MEQSLGSDVFLESMSSNLDSFRFLILLIFEFDLHFLLSSFNCPFPLVFSLAYAFISSMLAWSSFVVSKHTSQQYTFSIVFAS